jgi:CheY-like chemotaxis protein
MLEMGGYKVIIESLPSRAGEHIKLGGIDLMLCDICWDQQNAGDSLTIGLDAIFECRRNFPDLPIIGMSGFLRSEDLGALKNHGVAATLTKPFQLEELYSVVSAALTWVPDSKPLNE